tara:strand:+ start:3497 stop:3691 length:195 start_codon:yes stop_codon:yes gene_type:complete
MGIRSYYDQLLETAEMTGWDLKEACIDSGVADTTFYRWVNGQTSPRYKQAQIVSNFMERYATTR